MSNREHCRVLTICRRVLAEKTCPALQTGARVLENHREVDICVKLPGDVHGMKVVVLTTLSATLPLSCLFLSRFLLLCVPQVFYSNNAAREAFVELCESEYVQRVTFDSYLYKKVRTITRSAASKKETRRYLEYDTRLSFS